jgi:hypothetical protein
MLACYVDAFNRGDTSAYCAFYAPDVVLRNGGGTVLEGREAIVSFYAGVRLRLDRVMRIRQTVEGERSGAAALASRFTALQDGVSLAGEVLQTGDCLELESMALYEMAAGKFVRITASTISHRVLRAGETR